MRIRPIQVTGLKKTDYGARVAVSTAEVAGAPQVTVALSTEDAFGIPSILCHLKLSPAEAQDLSDRLGKAAREVFFARGPK